MQKLWPPLGNADFAPYISQLRRDVDAVYAQFSGADTLRFGKQYAEAGQRGDDTEDLVTLHAQHVLVREGLAAGGDIENVDRFLTALRNVDLSDSPRGPMKFDAYGNPIMNIYVRKVEKLNGRLQNTVIHTFPNISQFWTYTPEEFLKNPVYSRDNPPCRFC